MQLWVLQANRSNSITHEVLHDLYKCNTQVSWGCAPVPCLSMHSWVLHLHRGPYSIIILTFVFIPLASGGSGPMPPTPKPLFCVWFFLLWSHHSCKHTVSKFYYSWNLLLSFKHLASGAVVQTPACTPLHIYFIRFCTLLLLGATDSFLRFLVNCNEDLSERF